LHIQQIETDPDPYTPYLLSQAIRVGDLVFVSGQLALRPGESELIGGGIGPQTEQVLANMRAILEAAGSSLERVVKVTIFLTDMAASFPQVVELRRTCFTPPYPADTIVQVQALYRPEVMLEIEAVALA